MGTKNRSPGRTPTAKDVRELMVRVARENPTCGYTRLQGALKNLGYELGRNTIKGALAEHGIARLPRSGARVCRGAPSSRLMGALSLRQIQEHAWIFALAYVVFCMVTTRPPKTIVEPAALGTVANTDTKLLIYGLFQKGRVLAQDGVVEKSACREVAGRLL